MSKGSLNSTMSNPWPTPGLRDSPGVYDHNMSEGDLGRATESGPDGIPCKFYDTVPGAEAGGDLSSTFDAPFKARK